MQHIIVQLRIPSDVAVKRSLVLVEIFSQLLSGPWGESILSAAVTEVKN